MITALLAQLHHEPIWTGWSLRGILIAIVIICAAIGVVIIACQEFGVWPPPWAIRIFWILVVAVVAIFALEFLFSL